MIRATIAACAITLATHAAAIDPRTLPFAQYREGANSITLYHEPCSDQSVRELLAHSGQPAHVADAFKRADAVHQGNAIAACWIVQGADAVFIVYADGDIGRLPVREFKPVRFRAM